jgi:D-alanyl-lipoteichoic acid acyltransferase DltB (MBOAT superfamily)
LIFNSVTFLIFLAVVTALYWLLPRRPRLWMLFAASLTFYGFWRVEFLPLMLVSTCVDYVAAHGIHRSPDRRRRRAWLAFSLAVNLALLLYFKYLLFFAANGAGLLRAVGFAVADPSWDIVLPLGISFYTFQTISYTVDVYRGLIPPEREFALYACYVTFFPQLVAGPILRAREVTSQLGRRRRWTPSDLSTGLRRVLYGLFLKVVLADNLAPIVDAGFDQPGGSLGALDVWTLAFLFGYQIYFDFSAYSHIALGSARLMGIRFPENFNFPYVATSPRDFWKRWHISLSSWIRDYLYLPLMGEQVRDESTGGLAQAVDDDRERRRTRSLFLTWAIMGLWHGANWTFVLWGVYHALLVFAFRLTRPHLPKIPAKVAALGGWLITLPLVMLGWVPFRARSLGDALTMTSRVVSPAGYLTLGLRENTYLVAAVTLVAMLVAFALTRHVAPRLARRPWAWTVARTALYSAAIALVFVFLRPINQFIYFQF